MVSKVEIYLSRQKWSMTDYFFFLLLLCFSLIDYVYINLQELIAGDIVQILSNDRKNLMIIFMQVFANCTIIYLSTSRSLFQYMLSDHEETVDRIQTYSIFNTFELLALLRRIGKLNIFHFRYYWQFVYYYVSKEVSLQSSPVLIVLDSVMPIFQAEKVFIISCRNSWFSWIPKF